jgi:hypothetical protein
MVRDIVFDFLAHVTDPLIPEQNDWSPQMVEELCEKCSDVLISEIASTKSKVGGHTPAVGETRPE